MYSIWSPGSLISSPCHASPPPPHIVLNISKAISKALLFVWVSHKPQTTLSLLTLHLGNPFMGFGTFSIISWPPSRHLHHLEHRLCLLQTLKGEEPTASPDRPVQTGRGCLGITQNGGCPGPVRTRSSSASNYCESTTSRLIGCAEEELPAHPLIACLCNWWAWHSLGVVSTSRQSLLILGKAWGLWILAGCQQAP